MAKKQKRLWLVKCWHYFSATYIYCVYYSADKPACHFCKCKTIAGKKISRWICLAEEDELVVRLEARWWNFFVPHIKLRAGKVREIVHTKTGFCLKRGAK